MRWLRVAIAMIAFVVFIRWAGGQRAARIAFGGMWFMLTRPAVVVLTVVGTLAMGAFLWFSSLDSGHDPTAAPLLFLGISLAASVSPRSSLGPSG